MISPSSFQFSPTSERSPRTNFTRFSHLWLQGPFSICVLTWFHFAFVKANTLDDGSCYWPVQHDISESWRPSHTGCRQARPAVKAMNLVCRGRSRADDFHRFPCGDYSSVRIVMFQYAEKQPDELLKADIFSNCLARASRFVELRFIHHRMNRMFGSSSLQMTQGR